MEWRRSPPPHGIGVVPVVLKDLMETHIPLCHRWRRQYSPDQRALCFKGLFVHAICR